MGILHRLFNRRAPELWRAEMRLLHRLGYVKPPEAVQWISTSACELTCPHCYSHAGRKANGELTTEEACRLIIDELVELDRPTFVIAGGEPLLRPDFGQIVAHMARRRIPWALHSHGGHVHKQIDVFKQHMPTMVAISIDGPESYHDRFRGRPGCFARAMDAIQLLKKVGCPEVVAGTTITRQNADLVADMVPTILGSGADSWGLHLMTPEGRAGDNRHILATPGQLRRVAAFARRMRSIFHVELDNEWGSAGEKDCFYRDDPFMCGAGRSVFVVSATGEVMPCTTTDPAESQGNVRYRPLSRIWAEGFGRFRSGSDPGRSVSDDCWLQTRNGHSCRGAAFFGWQGEMNAAPGRVGAGQLVTLTIRRKA